GDTASDPAPGAAPAPAGGPSDSRGTGRPRPLRPGCRLAYLPRRLPLEIEECPVRRMAGPRPGEPNGRRWPDDFSKGGLSAGSFPSRTGMSSLLAAAVLGYLLGSIPFGLLLTRLAGLGDIRQIGPGKNRRHQV